MIELDGEHLSLQQVERVARARERAGLADAARARVTASREFLELQASSGAKVYGVNTGFGRMAEVVISPEQATQLQENLVRSHAAGVDDPMPDEDVRAIMVLRANALARGLSGCRPVVIDFILELLNRGVHPIVPRVGSVGASGDLAPLAHVALALIGESSVRSNGEVRPTAEVLSELDLEPLALRAKEGLALINGTQATTGLGVLALNDMQRTLEAAEVAGAMSLEALLGTPDAFDEEIQAARPHAGQAATAARLRHLLRDSEIRESHRQDDPRVQDPYSLRCMPQVHGAARQVLGYAHGVLEIEVNAATDNPLVFAESERILSGGNFHAQVVAQALDFLCIAAADLAAISERRVERILNPDLSGLPAFLARDAGLESGLMIVQVTAADLIGELRVLAHPASVDSVSTNAAREDHVSMGLAAARKVKRAAACVEAVIAIELLCAAEGLEHRLPLRPGKGVERAYAAIREHVPPLDGDRSPSADISRIREMIRGGAFDIQGADEQ